MPHVEVDHILCIGALDRDGKGFKRVESEGNQSSHGVVYRPSQQACLDLKLQQAGVPSIKPGGSGTEGHRERRTIKLFIWSTQPVSEK